MKFLYIPLTLVVAYVMVAFVKADFFWLRGIFTTWDGYARFILLYTTLSLALCAALPAFNGK